MNIKPIRTPEDYARTLAEVSRLVDLDPAVGSAEGDALEVLATLVENYEARHFPIEAPDPIEAIRFRMDQAGLTIKDLVPSIGQPNRVYEILSGKRELTLPMIRKLHKNLGIPAESLLGV